MKQSAPKPKDCPVCGKEFTPLRPMQAVCSPRCAARKVRSDKELAKLKEKKLTVARKEAIKSRAKWLAECQAVVNKYVRLKAARAGESCYTCGATPQQKFGGTFDASHFRSVGSAPHLRFWIPQIRICCVVCNRHKGGELLAFRRNLVAEHGADWVQQLEARQETAKFTIDYLKRLKKIMSKKVRRLEKRMDML